MLHARIFTDSVSFTDISRFGVEGMQVTPTRGWLYQPCDVAIMYGLANPQRRSLQGQLRNSIYREHKGPIVVIESSLLGRSFRPALPNWLAALRRRPLRPRQVHPYFRVALDGALGDDADFCAANSPPDRWEAQRRELGLEVAAYRRSGRHVLILGQVGRDASLRGLDIAQWLGETARAVRERSDRPIRVRLHPSMRWRDREKAIAACSEVADLTISPIENTFSADINDAWTCITYSSGGAVDALLAGVPPICLSPANLAYRLCSTSLDDIEAPLEPDRAQFLCDLAYSQWTPVEMANGAAWRHLLPAIERRLGETAEARAAQRLPGGDLPARRRRQLIWRLNAFTWLGQVLPKSSHALQGRAEALLRLGHAVEAKATFETWQRLRPDRASAFRGAAKAAEQLELWEDALAAWGVVGRLRPQQLGALSGVGRAALRLGRLDEAELAYRKLTALAPDLVEGLRGLERITNERGNWAEAIELQRRIWALSRDAAVAQRHALLLCRLDRLDEAKQFVAAISEQDEPLAYLFAVTQLYSAMHDWAGMDELLARHRAVTEGDWELLGMHVTALRRLGRIDDALHLVQRSSAGSSTQRASLTIGCLVEARRYAEADGLLQAAWEQGTIEKIGGGNLAAMVTAAQQIGGVPLARSVLEGLPISAGRAGRALKLNRLFQHLRLDSYEALIQGRLMTPDQPSEQRVLVAMDDEGAAEGTDVLRELVETLARHRRLTPDAHLLDASFLLQDALEVALRITDAADAKTPFSLLRLGDGEGAMLPYRPQLQTFRAIDLAENSRTWWGRDGSPTLELVGELQQAIRAADVIGIPDLDRATRIFYQTARTAFLANGRNMRGLLAATDFVATNCASAAWTTCHVHQSLAFWGLWDLILPRLGQLDLITCHAELGEVLARAHGVRIGRTHRIPPERKYAAAFANGNGEQHFPAVFEHLRGVLPETLPGRTVLVSAGMLGKIYCHWIKRAGGIAIDIGSAADHWCGYGTRGIADVAIYRSPTGTTDRVRSLIAAHWRYARLLGPDGECRGLRSSTA
ncbi:tetratricopeptide repeat protein [Devosia sp. A16]|uniref:tetratricopeptide repeat protein n=1 Tax=Devosia sp. A16 TaxID=1736675 RepID=UPI0006D84089|nr:tetratricopeptide repeat protein [Devosia sp. A16]